MAKKRKITIEYVQQQASDPNLTSTTWNQLLHAIGKEARPDLYLQDPTIRKCFSDWSWKQVAKLYGLKLSSRPPPTKYPSLQLPSSTISYIRTRFQTSYTTLGGPFSGYEASRNFFVADLVFPVAEFFGGAVTCDPEGKLGTSKNPEHFAWGEVEFVFRVLEMVTVKLVEAKKDNVQQGDAQAILELEVAGMENRANGVGIQTVYAIVTTGYLWSILSFTRTNGHTDRKAPQIHSSHAITFPHSYDPDSDEEVAQMTLRIEELAGQLLHCFLDGFVQALTALHNKFKLRYESVSSLESVAVKEEVLEEKRGEERH
ncbi:hypothetical protein HK104_004478, partial [Borealophlyctis nickersoniae]